MNPRASIILPTYNEAENLPVIVPKLHALDPKFEIVVVDDRSPDGTATVARELANRYPVQVLERSGKLGLASAVIDGVLQRATAPVIVVMDADLSHDEKIIPELVASVEAGSDIAIGSRFASGGSTEDHVYRRMFSWSAKQVARLVLGIRVQDPMSGFFCLHREAFMAVAPRLRPRGFKILLDLLVRMRPKTITEVGFRFRSREKGQSKLTGRIATQYFQMIWELWRDRR